MLGEYGQNSDLSSVVVETAAWLVGGAAVLRPLPLSDAFRSAGGVNLCLSLAVMAESSTLLATTILLLAELLTGNLKNLQVLKNPNSLAA